MCAQRMIINVKEWRCQDLGDVLNAALLTIT
jgi:hypothetical protein